MNSFIIIIIIVSSIFDPAQIIESNISLPTKSFLYHKKSRPSLFTFVTFETKYNIIIRLIYSIIILRQVIDLSRS